MLAIIAAITEVIKEKKGEETETEYFAGLLMTLDSVETNDSRTAVLSILSLLIKRVPAEVLRKQSSQVCKPLMKILSDSLSADNNALLRSVILFNCVKFFSFIVPTFIFRLNFCRF